MINGREVSELGDNLFVGGSLDIVGTKIKKLPPKPICYVGKKSIEIVLEDNKSHFLSFFYDPIYL